jgi:hypothetical protein
MKVNRTFEVVLTDAQLAAARAAHALPLAAGARSFHVDGVGGSDNVVEAKDANKVTTTISEHPFWVSTDDIEGAITDLLTAAPPVDAGAPSGAPSETGVLNMAMNDSTDSIVALQNAATTAAIGSTIQIDSEYMSVTDVSDPNNLQVTRATNGSAAAAHDVGATVSIWAPAA